MRFFISFFVVLMLMLTLVPLASAGFMVVNDSDIAIMVIYGYWDYSYWDDGDEGIFRIRGYYHVPPNESGLLWTPEEVTEVFARIWPQTQDYVVEHDRESYEFPVHPRLAFEVFSEADGTIVESNVPHDELVTRGDFYEYANNTIFRYQGGGSVNITDPNLRAAIEEALGKASGATISRADMLRLERLIGKDRGIENLTGLEFATNLTYLNLRQNKIGDISALANLTNLTRLYLSENNIRDISALANLTNLTDLNLWGNKIGNISVLARFTKLTSLSLAWNNIRDVSVLARLTKLTYLSLRNNKIGDISALANLTNLTKLYLNNNNIGDISALARLTKLTVLWLDNNKISDFSPIAGLIPNLEFYRNSNQRVESPAVNIPDPNLRAAIEEALGKASGATITRADMLTLTRLIGEDRGIENLTGLEFATNLTELRLKGNKIGDISALARLTKLTYLSLWENNIGDISVLANLTKLTELRLWGNKIGDISVLANLTNLTYLNLYGNKIGDISVLANLTNLTYLNLGSTNIGDISVLARLTKLTELYLHNNNIGNISALARLTKLTRLNLQNNKISDFSPIAGLIRNLEFYRNSNQRVLVRITRKSFDLSGYTSYSPYGGTEASLSGEFNILSNETFRSGETISVIFTIKDKHWRTGSYRGVPIRFTASVVSGGARATFSPSVVATDENGKAETLMKFGSSGGSLAIRAEVAAVTLKTEKVEFDFRSRHNRSEAVERFYRTPNNGIMTDYGFSWKGLRQRKMISSCGGGFCDTYPYFFSSLEYNGVYLRVVIDKGSIIDFREGYFKGHIEFVYRERLPGDDIPVGGNNLPKGIVPVYAPSLSAQLPSETVLLSNYPNPFNPETWIPYHLAEPAHIVLTIYTVDGKVVRRLDLGYQAAGFYDNKSRAAYWDGRNAVGERVASGVYFYTLTAGDFAATQKMLIMK